MIFHMSKRSLLGVSLMLTLVASLSLRGMERTLTPEEQEERNDELRDAAVDRDSTRVKKAINKGADPNTKDVFGDKPILFAVIGFNDPATVRVLLDAGANPNALEGPGSIMTPLSEAILQDSEDKRMAAVVKELLSGSNKATVIPRNLFNAAYDDKFDIVKILVEIGNVQVKETTHAQTPEEIARERGYHDIANYLAGKAIEQEAATKSDSEKARAALLSQGKPSWYSPLFFWRS
jgi:ankyrin repeat protein